MAKEWILNSAMNRFQLNFKRNVGPTSESIRKCSPKSIEEWREYYFKHVKPKEHIIELGKKLYTKITEVIQAFCPAQNFVLADIKVARNPLLHIASTVSCKHKTQTRREKQNSKNDNRHNI